jgi:hypothetical protein
MFEHGPLERRVMRDPETLRVPGGKERRHGDRLSRDPGLDRAVAAGETDAKNLGRRMLGIGAGADALLPFPRLAALRLSTSQ